VCKTEITWGIAIQLSGTSRRCQALQRGEAYVFSLFGLLVAQIGAGRIDGFNTACVRGQDDYRILL
jgi:hypothetical protein